MSERLPLGGENEPAAPSHWQGYLDPNDHIDNLIGYYAYSPLGGHFPNALEEGLIITDFQQGVESPARLVGQYKAMIAVIARSYKFRGADTVHLLRVGSGALLKAADSYAWNDSYSFADHATLGIEAALSEFFPDAAPQPEPGLPVERPMERTLRRLEEHKAAETTRVAIMQEFNFTKLEQKVLLLLPLPPKILGEKIGKKRGAVYHAQERCWVKTQTQGITELALLLYRKGLRYDVINPQKLLKKTTDMEIALRLEESSKAIAKSMSVDNQYIDGRVEKMKIRTGARSRVELALMAEIHGINLLEPAQRAVFETAAAGVLKSRKNQ